jgi:hypothetical protein
MASSTSRRAAAKQRPRTRSGDGISPYIKHERPCFLDRPPSQLPKAEMGQGSPAGRQ